MAKQYRYILQSETGVLSANLIIGLEIIGLNGRLGGARKKLSGAGIEISKIRKVITESRRVKLFLDFLVKNKNNIFIRFWEERIY